MRILFCPQCKAAGKALFLDTSGIPMYMCLVCGFKGTVEGLAKFALMDKYKLPGGGDE